MRMLVVTPYPPLRDGIASYAVQAVAALRAQGHEVEVLSPGPSAAHHHLDLVGPRGALALAKRVRAYDRLVVQYHPDVFHPVPSSARERVAESLALAAVFRLAPQVEVRVHEVDYRTGRRLGPEGAAARAMWRAVDRIVVHTEPERQDFLRAFGVRPEQVVLEEHGRDFVRRTSHDRTSARRSLGIGADAVVFLAIGFIQPHKGFDRAVQAFAGLASVGAELHVVGSVRVEEPGFLAHLDELSMAVRAIEGAHLHEGYLSDELFDRWLVAADRVVLPYRNIWSSGVLERASLYGTAVIATAVGGLALQAAGASSVTLVQDDEQLRVAMRQAAGGSGPAAGSRTSWPLSAGAAQLQAEVRRRAAVTRGNLTGVAALPPPAPHPAGSGRRVVAPTSGASVPLRRVHPLQLPAARSGRPGAAIAKRVVRRLTAWQLDPLVWQVNAVQAATVESLERLAAQSGQPLDEAGPRGGPGSGQTPPTAPVALS